MAQALTGEALASHVFTIWAPRQGSHVTRIAHGDKVVKSPDGTGSSTELAIGPDRLIVLLAVMPHWIVRHWAHNPHCPAGRTPVLGVKAGRWLGGTI